MDQSPTISPSFEGIMPLSGAINGHDISSQPVSTINGTMVAFACAATIIIGVYGIQTCPLADLVKKVTRRAHRENLFDKVINVKVTKKPDLTRIQAELATALGFTMKEKSEAKRAAILLDRIKMEKKLLIILEDVHKGLDLHKLGIPHGDDLLKDCKILLTSSSGDILSNQMQAHRVFQID
ncbi:uncharacterized protein LOC129284907 [Prosopis cineraria]|uniref:uncharacterized protein LOC129284907 n=1 Tax=Prosopis cineraria TaxID=364024 RepID=UPI00240EFEDE|nr:uncharacterized protein LOC129284907 [Prosopis cineraria]